MSDSDEYGRSDLHIFRDAHEHYKEIYALFFTASVSGQKVQVWTNTCEYCLPKIYGPRGTSIEEANSQTLQ